MENENGQEESTENIAVENADAPEDTTEGTSTSSDADSPQTEELPLLRQEIETLRAQVADSHAKLADMQNKYMRSHADHENFRKRMNRERDENIARITMSVIEDIIPAIDNMKLGLTAAEQHPEAKVVSDGFSMVVTQLMSALGEHGLEEIPTDGETFDPNIHECLAYQASEEVDEGIVMNTSRTGYKVKGRLLRPSSVVVSKGNEAEDNKED